MSDMSRLEAVRRLERILKSGDGTYEFEVEINTDDQKAIQLAMSSLKTDEAYQLEYERTTKNDLGIDAISREQAIDAFPDLLPNIGYSKKAITEILQKVPSVTPQFSSGQADKQANESIKGHCKDCKYFEYDSVAKIDGVPLIVAHEICSKWGEGCKTNENGYCFLFESKSRVKE